MISFTKLASNAINEQVSRQAQHHTDWSNINFEHFLDPSYCKQQQKNDKNSKLQLETVYTTHQFLQTTTHLKYFSAPHYFPNSQATIAIKENSNSATAYFFPVERNSLQTLTISY